MRQKSEFVRTGAMHHMNPRDFLAEYVDPAITHYHKHKTVKHLAAHAIAQLDTLAEVVALWQAPNPKANPKKKKENPTTKYRDELGVREPALATIRDAHDSCKHGPLIRKSAKTISKGQRPQTKTLDGMFLGHYHLGGPMTQIFLVFVFDNGTEASVAAMLHAAREAWDREFARLKL